MSDAAFNGLSVGVAVVCAAAAAGAALLRALRRGAPVSMVDVIGAGAVAGALGLGTGVALPGVNAFGLFRFAYLIAVVSAPAAALAVLALRARGRIRTTRSALVCAVAALAAPLCGAWGTFVEPRRLRLERAELAARGAPQPAIRIGILADLQTDLLESEHESRAIDLLVSEKPDLILFAGDLIQAAPSEVPRVLSRVRALLARLDAPGGVFFVHGDVDQWWQGQESALFAGTSVQVVTDAVAHTRVRGRDVTIGGVSLAIRDPGRSSHARDTVRALEAAPGEHDLRILLSHAPDAVYALAADSRVDLVVAGHTHGGQIALPLIGPLLTLSRVPRIAAAGGLHQVESNGARHWLYVTRGIGMERMQAPRVRFLCPPDVSVLTVR
jgi:predicted MPP superfamily phosphohydrolase